MATPAVTPNPEVNVNTPAAEIAKANQESQGSPTPGQPRNADGTFAAPPPAAPAPLPEPTPENPVVTQDLGQGKFKVKYVTGETFEGTAAEVLAKTGQAHVNTKLWAQNKAKEVEQPPAAPVQPTSRFKSPEEKQVADYVANLLGFDNIEALEHRFGYVEQNTTDYASQSTALKFQAAQPDYNPTPDNSAKLMQVINDSGVGEAFDAATPEQQVRMLQQAHAYCLMTKVYDAKPQTTAAPAVPVPPPPAPGGRAQVPQGQLPDNLIATMSDTPEQIKAKWEEARRLGLA